MWKSGVENVSDFFARGLVSELHTRLPLVINRVSGMGSRRFTRRLALGPG
jgi:hypothetical protein